MKWRIKGARLAVKPDPPEMYGTGCDSSLKDWGKRSLWERDSGPGRQVSYCSLSLPSPFSSYFNFILELCSSQRWQPLGSSTLEQVPPPFPSPYSRKPLRGYSTSMIRASASPSSHIAPRNSSHFSPTPNRSSGPSSKFLRRTPSSSPRAVGPPSSPPSS